MGQLLKRGVVVHLGLATAIAACGGEVITLGEATPEAVFLRDGVPVEAQAGLPVANINDRGPDENPTLTADLLEIYFTSRREIGP